MKLSRLALALIWISSLGLTPSLEASPRDEDPSSRPNFVVIFVDDLGYGDLGCFGHPTIRTPVLDRLAVEGQRWTSFYVAASVCTPSRAGLLTGRLPIRSGMCSNRRRVLFPDSKGGLPASELTIAEALREGGYRTAAIGKWHLGHLPQFLPTKHGFESYYGIPYSNDMDRVRGAPRYRKDESEASSSTYNVPLMRDEKIVERPANQKTIVKRFTEEAVRKIEAFRDEPFFIYLAHNLPHIPLFRSKAFEGKSRRGIYGDVIEEIDWSVGQVVQALKKHGLEKRTLLIFTSDNGPWAIFDTHGGTAGLLRGAKGGTFEGGMREPTVFWGPGLVKPGVVNDMGATLDLLPTFCSMAGVPLPQDRILDGHDLSPVLRDLAPSPRETVYYYRGQDIFAVRHGAFKAHFKTRPEYGRGQTVEHDPPLLYHLDHDPSEKYNVADAHPEVIREIVEITRKHRESVKPVTDQLSLR